MAIPQVHLLGHSNGISTVLLHGSVAVTGVTGVCVSSLYGRYKENKKEITDGCKTYLDFL